MKLTNVTLRCLAIVGWLAPWTYGISGETPVASGDAGARPDAPESLDEVFAPVVVGAPPVNAFNGLFRCPDGEIRHYGGDGFVYSRDHGLTWRRRRLGEADAAGRKAGGGVALGRSPATGTCLRLVSGFSGTFVHRSTDGPDGEYTARKIDASRVIMVRPPWFLTSRPRILFVGHLSGVRPHRISVFRSDDDGLTWKKSVLAPGPAFEVRPPHRGPRWENWCVEPTVLELEGGRLWMLARTSRDRHRECFSEDGGETWSSWRPSGFYGTLTMPTLHRLRDGRVLLLWCNTTPLPEVDRTGEPIPETAKNGRWEDVFTNRDACHVAISEDDGRTWIGFREMRLNPYRNAGDFGRRATHDFSVHQPQALELPGDKVLVAHGQDEEVRRLVVFDTRWLYEPRRRSSFGKGLEDWSTHKYRRGIVGHCAYDRTPGPRLIEHPDRAGGGARVLHIRHPIDPRLVFDRDGAVWNFPAAVKGSFTTRIRLRPEGGGARICLLDRWLNPTDPVVESYAMYVLEVPGDGRLGEGVSLTVGRWHELGFEWDDSRASRCRLTVDGEATPIELPLGRPAVHGVSYVHFQALSSEEDLAGFLVESVEGGRVEG